MQSGKDEKKRSYIHRKRQLFTVLTAAGLVLFGLVRLTLYGAAYLSSRSTSRELQQIRQSLPADPPAPAIPDRSLPAATDAPTFHPETIVFSKAQSSPVPMDTQAPPALLPVSGYPDNPGLQMNRSFKELRKKSRNIVGWLSIDHLLEEAVPQKNDTFYLTHDALGKANPNGAIFLDASVSLKTRPGTYLLYGHNMKTGAMFGCLRNYDNQAFYHASPFISFDTLYENGRFVIFAAGNVSTEETRRNYLDFRLLLSRGISDRQAAIDTLIAASRYTCTVDVRPEDQLLLLVTCVEDDNERRVIAARRVRDDEEEASLKRLVSGSYRK